MVSWRINSTKLSNKKKLNKMEKSNEQSENKPCTIHGVSKSLPDFERCNKPDFLKRYKDVCGEELLLKIWEFGNKRWSEGYNQGKYNPDFD